MNRRNALRAFFFGAPAAAIVGVASTHASQQTSPCPTCASRRILPSQPATFSINVDDLGLSIRGEDVAKAVSREMRRIMPDMIARHNRNPMRRG